MSCCEERKPRRASLAVDSSGYDDEGAITMTIPTQFRAHLPRYRAVRQDFGSARNFAMVPNRILDIDYHL
jgi:hypothetical protein